VLVITVFFRKNMIPHFKLRYRGWRYFHGGLAVSFTVLALWHSIALGRHTDLAMSIFFVTLALLGFAMLAKLYLGGQTKAPSARTASAQTVEGTAP
jgi:predicted ferric reductase